LTIDVSIGRWRSKKQRKLTRPEYRDPRLSDIGSGKIIISCGSADTLFAAVLHAGELLVSDVPPRGRPCDHDKCRGSVEGCSCAVPLPHRGRRITRARRACAAPTAALAIAAREAKVGRAPCWRAGA